MTDTGESQQRLWQLMNEVARSRTPAELHDHALRCLFDTLHVERAAVLLFDETRRMRFVAWRGLSDAYRAAVEGHSPWRPDDRDAEPVLVPDVRAEPSLADFAEVFAHEEIVALAFVPVAFGDRLLGKFMLYYREPHSFTASEIAVARTIAGHIAFALEHHRTRGDLEERLFAAEGELARRRQLEQHRELLVRAGHVLSTSLDIEHVLDELTRLVVPDFAEWYVVQLAGPEGTIATQQVGHVDPEKTKEAWAAIRRWPPRLDRDRGVAAAIRTGASSLVASVGDDALAMAAHDDEHLRYLKAADLGSVMIVPLALPDRNVGAMTFAVTRGRAPYGPEELAVAEAIASRVAIAIDKARLYEEAKASAERLDVIAKTSEALAGVLDPDEALRALAHAAVATLADYCVAYRLASDGDVLRVGVAHADPARQALVERLVFLSPPRAGDPTGSGAVLATGAPILAERITPEMLAASASGPDHLEVLLELGPRSCIVVPLQARGHSLGAVALATTDRSGRLYSRDDVKLVQDLAHRAALLVDNARLYTEAKNASRARDEMMAIVSHDLRSPLHTIMTACELLELDPPPERRMRSHASIRRAARQMGHLLDDLLDVTRIEMGQLSTDVEPVDVPAMLAEIVSMHGPVAEDRAVRLLHEVDSSAGEVAGDRNRLCQALSNLVGNALKFTPGGGEVRLSAAAENGHVRISVADTGPGIATDEIPHLFDRFWRGDRKNRTGLGLGLAIAKGIATAHGGDIAVTSVVGRGSEFTLVLPTNGPAEPQRI